MALRLADMIDKHFFHVGMIVPHVETAMDELGALLGLTWAGIHEQLMPTYQPGVGHRDIPLRVGYSQDRPFLELIQAVPDTPWALAEDGGSNLHHLGFFTDDLGSDHARVGNGFCPIEICATGAEQAWPSVFTYHNDATRGLRIELVQHPR
ncbi:MAG: VOC family protein [Acidimicrobiia bacterium]